MTDIGRNDKCPCENGKKYKHCYGKINGDCPLRVSERRKAFLAEHHAREKEVMGFINDITLETTFISLKNDKGRDQIPLRVQMIVLFSLVDVLASYWYEFRGVTGKTGERSTLWYREFCAIEQNEQYRAMWKNVTPERLYRFRNALVHFFGLGETEILSITLCPNHISSNELTSFERKFAEKGVQSLIIQPIYFSKLIKLGALIMLNQWIETIKTAQGNRDVETEYIAAIKRVWDKVQKEGAVSITEEESRRVIMA